MRYLPNTGEDRRAMLAAIGAGSVAELFADIPEETRLKRPLELPPPMAESGLRSYLKSLAGQNWTVEDCACFLGAGAYDHYIPSVVGQLISRNEFYTAYTPYQPEVSQGTLQSIYEYQTMIAELTGMDVANASMYDGASAAAEAILLSMASNRRRHVVISRAVHPDTRTVCRTYTGGQGVTFDEAGVRADGTTDPAAAGGLVSDETTCLIVQYPNFFGVIEPLAELAEAAHARGALLVVVANPIALGILTPPGAFGADVVCGEGQPLGIPLGFGGPYLGFFACLEKYQRRMAGRLSGMTVDSRGQRAYVLTLQTREQHIRREKATSNICSNEALCALAACVYLSTLGKQGLREVASQCLHKAHYAYERITQLPGFEPAFAGPFFNEFVVRAPAPARKLQEGLAERRMLGPIDLGRFYPEYRGMAMFAVTEKRTRKEIDGLVSAMEVIAR
jgi:glycine dehydrogenase subunit 1